MPHIDVQGLSIAYEREGTGPPLVLLHGYVGDGKSSWGNQLNTLSDQFTVIVWDAPGAGGSADPPEDFGIAGYADCLADFVVGLGVERAHVGGLSFGGALALALAQRRPAIAQSLVLVSAYAGWAGSLPHDVAGARLAQALSLSEDSPADFVGALLPSMFATSPSMRDLEMCEASVRRFHPIGFRAMARASFEDLRPGLGAIDVPALLVYGEKDERAPRTVAEALHAALRDSHLVVLPDTGHVCTLESPTSVDREIRAFLSALG